MNTIIRVVSVAIILILWQNMSGQISDVKSDAEQSDDMGKEFVAAIRSLSINEFVRLKPTVEMWKVILPDECIGKTDEEIASEQINNKQLQFAFNNIVSSVKDNNLDVNKLRFVKSGLEKLGETPVALNIFYSYEDKNGQIRITLASYNYRIYLDDIKNSYRIFNYLE